MSGPGGPIWLPDTAWKAARHPNRDGPRRGRRFGTGAPYSGRAGTTLLIAALIALAVLFLAVSCLA